VRRLVFVGPMWTGSTTVQRLHAFQRTQGLLVTWLGPEAHGITFRKKAG